MHQLIKASIELAYSQGYIDRLQRDVYKVPEPELRELNPDSITEITRAHGKKDGEALLNALLDLDKFPIDDVYVGPLRIGGDEIVSKNPETTKRITKRLLSMRVEELIALCRQPKAGNRQLGEAFHNWFRGLGYPKLSEDSFRNVEEYPDVTTGTPHKILTLDGSRKQFKEFANKYLDCGVDKELDLLFKVNGEYVIGEAKYVSAFGGNQDAHIEEGLDFIHSSRGDAIRIAVLDGVVWYDTQNKISKRVRRTESIAMSALLLPHYIENMANPVF